MREREIGLEALVRALARCGGTRRSLLARLASVVAVATPFSSVTGAKRKKKKRCKRRKTCGSGCCNADRCFAKQVDPDSGLPLSFGCCPAKQVCRGPDSAAFADQCCYPDERCQPELANNPDADSICCRRCNGACCKVFEECIDGVCTPLLTARLPRTRRR